MSDERLVEQTARTAERLRSTRHSIMLLANECEGNVAEILQGFASNLNGEVLLLENEVKQHRALPLPVDLEGLEEAIATALSAMYEARHGYMGLKVIPCKEDTNGEYVPDLDADARLDQQEETLRSLLATLQAGVVIEWDAQRCDFVQADGNLLSAPGRYLTLAFAASEKLMGGTDD